MSRESREIPEVRRLAKIIDCIARKCWMGIPALLGHSPEPTKEQIKNAIFFRPSRGFAAKVQGGSQVPEDWELQKEIAYIDEYEPLLKSVTWDVVVSAVQWYAVSSSDDWRLYVDFLQRKETSHQHQSAAVAAGQGCGLSERTVRRIVQRVPLKIAMAAHCQTAQAANHVGIGKMTERQEDE